MYGSWMCKKDSWLYVLSLREIDNIDQTEIDLMFDRVAFYSIDYYSKLTFKYQGSWTPKPQNTTGGSTPPNAVYKKKAIKL